MSLIINPTQHLHQNPYHERPGGGIIVVCTSGRLIPVLRKGHPSMMPPLTAVEVSRAALRHPDDKVLMIVASDIQSEVEAAMFIALSQFTVANGMTKQVKNAFASRPHLVEEAPGFLRLEVISPLDNRDEIWLLTYWDDEESFKAWHHSHMYHDSHRGIPKGLKLVPRSARLRFFEHVAS